MIVQLTPSATVSMFTASFLLKLGIGLKSEIISKGVHNFDYSKDSILVTYMVNTTQECVLHATVL